MRGFSWKRAFFWTLLVLFALALCLVLLRGIIEFEARATGDRAADEFGGDRIGALAALVAKSEHPLKERNRAVWALGVLEDPRALPVLKKYYTGGKCDHATALCQYELGKAIKKIEGTWDFHASRTFRKGFPPAK